MTTSRSNLVQFSQSQKDKFFSAVLSEVRGDPHMMARLFEMGFSSGQEIECRGRMPFGGGLIVRIHTTLVALREEEASCLWI